MKDPIASGFKFMLDVCSEHGFSKDMFLFPLAGLKTHCSPLMDHAVTEESATTQWSSMQENGRSFASLELHNVTSSWLTSLLVQYGQLIADTPTLTKGTFERKSVPSSQLSFGGENNVSINSTHISSFGGLKNIIKL
ncbi:hypothetical protein LOAG_01805 [Loa loa]|uniref:Uncharacterized protein n=1 Tax=Loa loa TaxID=7209 RepID=A0A1S0U8G1_LOALO|nr:hypothetical protein LOAG_01805 [Loa loa]EFO26684.1 hypothetical protein LOAG_01805 [Loa loa]